MFTGLIQDLGYIQSKGDYQIQISCSAGSAILSDLEIGDSIAVDGACLTVEQILAQGFIVSVSPETLQRTTLGQRSAQEPVNLEASLRVGSKIGGHFVTGHVDGSAVLASAKSTATSWELRFCAVSPFLRSYLLPKGSIAVNGVSLTIATCDDQGEWFTAAVIPHTYDVTNLHRLKPDSPVNLEADILGKYVHRLIQRPGSTKHWPGEAHPSDDGISAIDDGFLTEHGYL